TTLFALDSARVGKLFPWPLWAFLQVWNGLVVQKIVLIHCMPKALQNAALKKGTQKELCLQKSSGSG
ncbi:MAG: hypothetical protein AAFQ78_03395, partial [Bacteroidota bacterium]